MVLQKRILIVAPWGNPYKWRETVYTYGKNKMIRSCSSLIPLLNLSKEIVENGSTNVVIIVLDTLIQELEPEEISKLPSYRDLLDVIEAKINKKIIEFIKEAKCLSGSDFNFERLVENTKIDIIVAPGIGRFKIPKLDLIVKFDGDISIFYLLVYLKLLEKVIEIRPHEIWLDLTHGINFMPTVVYKVINEVISTMMLNNMSIKLRIFNSDPYDRELRDQNILNINEIGIIERFTKMNSFVYNYPVDFMRAPERLMLGLDRILNKQTGCLIEKLHKAIKNGYVLYLLEGRRQGVIPEFQIIDYVNKLNIFLDERLDKIELRRENQNLIIKTSIMKAGNGISIQDAVDIMKIIGTISSVLDKVNEIIQKEYRYGGFTLKGLKELAYYLSEYNPGIKTLFNRERIEFMKLILAAEIDDSENKEKIPIKNEFVTLGKLKDNQLKESKNIEKFLRKDYVRANLDECIIVRYCEDLQKIENRFNERNFIAHLGLLYELVQLKLVPNSDYNEIISKLREMIADKNE